MTVLLQADTVVLRMYCRVPYCSLAPLELRCSMHKSSSGAESTGSCQGAALLKAVEDPQVLCCTWLQLRLHGSDLTVCLPVL